MGGEDGTGADPQHEQPEVASIEVGHERGLRNVRGRCGEVVAYGRAGTGMDPVRDSFGLRDSYAVHSRPPYPDVPPGTAVLCSIGVIFCGVCPLLLK
ncbi:hypothetical protein GCM10010230_59960 [Streptomyces narbonensis]|nr:hypothetical protein GCM10010230_59960 [Streptomyces narbonensis]